MPRRSFCSEPPCARDRGLGRLNPAERKRRERARKIRSVAEVQELVRLGPRLPEHIEPYAQFLREREGRAPSLREAVKAYTITRSSVRRQGRKDTTVCRYFPELAQIRPHPGERSVRPEDAFSVLLLTPWGRRYLDAAERGRFDRQAAKQIVDRLGRCRGHLYHARREHRSDAPRRPSAPLLVAVLGPPLALEHEARAWGDEAFDGRAARERAAQRQPISHDARTGL
jgi:hypothetical protein